MPNKILQGNVTDKLKELETGTVQCVVTSPPYWGLRDYGTAAWEGGFENCDHLQPQGKPRNERPNKTNCGIGKGGNHFEAQELKQYFKECKKCGAKRIDQQLGLEETPEEYVEKMVEVFREIKRVLKKDGTVWLNLGDSYAGSNSRASDGGRAGYGTKREGVFNNLSGNLKTKDIVGIPWRVAFALQADGWYLRQDIIWHKPAPMPESVTDRCTKAHEYIFLLTKSAKYKFNQLLEDLKPSTFNDKRLFNKDYTEQRKERNYPGNAQQGSGMLRPTEGKANKRSVWSINTQPYREAHFAVFPQKLPELCIKAGSSEGDIVLDPFFGSGTTGYVAQKLGRRWIGIELNEDYIKIANKRFAQQDLFVA